MAVYALQRVDEMGAGTEGVRLSVFLARGNRSRETDILLNQRLAFEWSRARIIIYGQSILLT